MVMEDKKPNTHLNNGGEQQPVDPVTQKYKAVSRSFKKNPKTGEDMFLYELEEADS